MPIDPVEAFVIQQVVRAISGPAQADQQVLVYNAHATTGDNDGLATIYAPDGSDIDQTVTEEIVTTDSRGSFTILVQGGVYNIEVGEGAQKAILRGFRAGTSQSRDAGVGAGQVPTVADLSPVALAGNWTGELTDNAGKVIAVNGTEDGFELIDPPEGGGGGGDVNALSQPLSDRWRILPTKLVSGSIARAYNVELRDRNGNNLATGGTPIGTGSGTALAFNGDREDGYWQGSTVNDDWFGYEFASPVEVHSVLLEIPEQPPATSPSEAIVAFRVQRSFDGGTTWFDAAPSQVDAGDWFDVEMKVVDVINYLQFPQPLSTYNPFMNGMHASLILDGGAMRMGLQAPPVPVNFFYPDTPSPGQVLMAYPAPVMMVIESSVEFPIFAGSVEVPPDATWTMALTVNGSPAGSIEVSDTGACTLTIDDMSGFLMLQPGDVLRFVADAEDSPAEASISGIGVTILLQPFGQLFNDPSKSAL